MSILVPCPKRASVDKYATAKSNATFFLNAGLLADTAGDLYFLSGGQGDSEKRLWIWLIVLTALTLLIEIIGIIISLILSICKYPCHKIPDTELANRIPAEEQSIDGAEVVKKCPRHLRYANDTLTILMFVLMVLVAIKNALKSNYGYVTTSQNNASSATTTT